MDASDRVYRLIYVSSAVEYFDQAALEALLAQARTNNARLGITGLLLYGEGAFLQLLEGPREAVESLYATIREDPRHTLCLVLDEETHVPRLFGEWRMAFQRLSRDTVAAEEGFSDFLASDSALAELLAARPEPACRMLLAFRDRPDLVPDPD